QALSEASGVPRWQTHNTRAYTAWIAEDDTDDGGRTAFVVVEHLDTPLEPDRNYRIFIGSDVDEDEPLTPRNRFVLWQALWFISSDLDAIGDDFDVDLSMVYGDMPLMTRDQPTAWWRKLATAANELCEAARQADFNRLVPRTPADEALIALATGPGYIEAARDQIADFGFQGEFDALPHADYDGDFEEILPDLTGDTDILLLWSHRLDGIEKTDSLVNQLLGIGDYEATSWHKPFSGRR
ncbi:hypothetical protein, partial [Kitasatospora herbaricolor]|uniref:hypothetical protein n=1 Tax=Kitasatospora herbaricolor TaxID=68217 RepID=UPI0036DBA047